MKMNYEKYKKYGHFILNSGDSSNHYYDIKEAMGEPDNLQEMCKKLLASHPISRDECDLFVGLDYGGIPLAVACSIITGKPYAILRKKRKTYGTMKKIEGWQRHGKVFLLDDVKHTGKSINSAERYLESQGYEVINKVVAFERDDG